MIRRVKALARGEAEVEAGAVRLRREIHARPETAFEEIETGRLVADRMRARSLAVRTGVGRTGVQAVLDTGRPGKTVLLRADMDALPIEEIGDADAASNLRPGGEATAHRNRRSRADPRGSDPARNERRRR